MQETEQVTTGSKINIMDFFFNFDDYTLTITVNFIFLLLLCILTITIYFIIGKFKNKHILNEIDLVKIKYKISGVNFEYEVNRNFQNIEIAHKIYIELITRKAAIKITENDVITEVYDSWYTLFKTTREELKSIRGNSLIKSDSSKELVPLLTDILNEGLRPHLTEYQAKYRKWYSQKSQENMSLTPQEIQKNYPEYSKLFNDIKKVNTNLINYSSQLLKIIEGTK